MVNLQSIAILNLRRRKAKAAFVLAGLVVGVTAMVGLSAMTDALTHEINHKLEKYGANILIVPRSDQLSLSYEGLSLGGFSFETRELRQADLAGISSIKNSANIAAVGPMVLGPIDVAGKSVLLAGVDFEAAEMLKPWWKVRGAIPKGDELLVGSEAARVLGLAMGQEVTVNGRKLKISGLLTPTGSQDDSLVFSTLPLAQTILGKQGLVSMVEVAALCKDCPVDAMVDQISRVLPDASVMAIQSVVKGRMETIGHFRRFALGVSALLVLVGGLVVLVTMMGSVKERTREIGIFRALGFRKSHVVRVVLLEAVMLSTAAGVLGYGLGLAAGQMALPWFAQSKGATLAFDPWLAVGALGLALAAGIGASLYPALSAARLDPAQALRTL